MRQRLNNTDTVGALVVTILFHGLLVAAAIYGNLSNVAEAEVEADSSEWMEFEAVELLQWGDEMPDPNALPTIANPEEETQVEDVVSLAEPEDEPEPEPEDEPEAEDEPVAREERNEDRRRDSDHHSEHRPTNDEAIQGSPDGFRGGTSLSPTALANLFGPVQAQIQRNFRAPSSLSADQLRSLTGRVRVFVNEDGRITRFRWVEESGNGSFDMAVERSLNTFRTGSQRLRLPRQNEQAMAQAVQHGFIVTIRHGD